MSVFRKSAKEKNAKERKFWQLVIVKTIHEGSSAQGSVQGRILKTIPVPSVDRKSALELELKTVRKPFDSKPSDLQGSAGEKASFLKLK